MAGGPWLSGYGRAKPRTPGMAAAFSKMRGGGLRFGVEADVQGADLFG